MRQRRIRRSDRESSIPRRFAYLCVGWGAHTGDHLVRYCAAGDSGTADLVSYFFRRLLDLSALVVRPNRHQQHLAGFHPSSGLLNPFARKGPDLSCRVERALAGSGQRLRGTRLVERGLQDCCRSRWSRCSPDRVRSLPARRKRGEPLSFPWLAELAGEGQKRYGRGFVLNEDTATALIEDDPHNEQVIFKYLSGTDINKNPDHDSDRWVINFRLLGTRSGREYPAVYDIIERDVKPVRARSRTSSPESIGGEPQEVPR